MEAQIGGETRRFYGNGTPDLLLKEKGLMGVGQSQEWNSNDWKWDGNLFLATPLNSGPSDCRSLQLFSAGSGIPAGWSSRGDEISGGKLESEKRRRVVMVEEDYFDGGEAAALTLKLGEQVYPISETDAKNGKKSKLEMGGSASGALNRSACQVENCGADLNNAKDYHKRHKVCETHSKATSALVGNVMQRFCQQCSRFHVLQEFDEGKRSCRRRLAGHNRRRRKTHPDSAVGGNSLIDDRASSYLIISLLKILSNLHSNSSDKTKDQDLLSHILRNLASFAGTFDGTGLSELLQATQALQNVGPSVAAASEKVPPTLLSNAHCVTAQETSRPLAAMGMDQKGFGTDSSASETPGFVPTQNFFSGPCGKAEAPISLEPMLQRGPTVERVKLNNFDLNSIYYEPQDCMVGTGSPDCPLWVMHDSHQASPPQTSGNSYSGSAESPSSSNGDAQSRTDRIVFKLFGKDPHDFPLLLRGQILDWLSNSPTEIESYIRPGCIILTIYLRLTESAWEEICCSFSSCLTRLLDISDDVFWRSGWIYATVAQQIAFIYNGRVMVDSPLCWKIENRSKISSITPIAVSVSEKAKFTVKGFNLSCSTAKLFCAYEGSYLVQETGDVVVESSHHKDFQSVSFFCSIPNLIGRGFIEVDDQDLSSDFFPFIVAEQDVCSEICMLESTIEEVMDQGEEIQKKIEKLKAKNQALEFLQEIGWLLQRSHLKSRLADMDSSLSLFPQTRFKWLLEFSMDHDWCAVAKKLLDILFDGNVDRGTHPSIKLMVAEMGLLHGAIRRKSRRMVEFLLKYAPDWKTSVKPATQQNQRVHETSDSFIFKPDEIGPAGMTPLHIAASSEGAEDVLDALTDDPALGGIEAWKNVKDKTGFTPEDYARLRGYYSYIQLVQKKIDKKLATEHVILDIPGRLLKPSKTQKRTDSLTKETSSESCKFPGLQIENCRGKAIQQYCRRCDQQLAYRNRNSSLLYRPAMLSMVAIAAVCVCVALIFKGPPEVLFVFPFRWELLGYGAI